MSVRLATGPVSWGVDFAAAPRNPPWPEVLDGMAAAGYAGLELGPLGYLPTDPARLAEELRARDLEVAGSFVFEPLHDPDRLDDVIQAARTVSALVAAVGGRHLVVIDLVSDARERRAGRSQGAPRLDAGGRAALRSAIRQVRAVAEDAGLTAAVHPHAGTYVEFADEIEAVAEVAALCLDTGHLAYAGLDPVATYARLRDRVALLHLKDVDPVVLGRAHADGLGYWAAMRAGVFCPVGQGAVDFRAFAGEVEAAAYDGWATVEQDRVPGGDPVHDLVESRRVLEALGLGLGAAA